MLFSFIDDPKYLIYLVPIIIISLTFHEAAHAFVSYKLGDSTAKDLGRLTLNPLRHLDVFGTLMLLLTSFGWAKPVPINPMYYKNRKTGTMLVSLAGPLSNLLLSFVSLFIMTYMKAKYGYSDGLYFSLDGNLILYSISIIMFTINLNLAIFNIIPIPPLDGSKILGGILPDRYYYKMLENQNYFSIIFMLLFLVFPSVISIILYPLKKVILVGMGVFVDVFLKLII